MALVYYLPPGRSDVGVEKEWGKEVTVGPISVQVRNDGTYLKINQTINDALLTAILKKEGLPPLEPKVSATLRKRLGEWIRITDRKLTRDGFVEVAESPDMLKLRLVYHPALGSGKDLTVDEIIQVLIEKENVVPEFIKPDAIRDALRRPGNAIVVAEGIPPKPGKDARIVVVPMEKMERIPDAEDEPKRVDWRKLSSSVITVKSGEPVVEKVPPTDGEPGKGVRGEFIPPTPGKDIDLSTVVGKGLEIEENMRLIAKKTGILKQENGKFHIDEIFVVEGDLDFEVGNIKDVKHIEIRGNVLPGFYVKVDGMVIVRGSVENATIEAGGNVYVGGIITQEKGGYIKAGGWVYAKEFLQSKVEAAGSVYTESGFRHSDIMSGEHIIATNPKSRTSGGILKARGNIYLGICGNIHGTKTEVIAGHVSDLREKVAEIDKEISELRNKMETLEGALPLLRSAESKGKTKAAIKTIQGFLKEKEAEKETLQKTIRNAINMAIYVANRAYMGTSFVLADTYVYNTKEDLEKCVLKLDENGEFGPLPWRKPPFKVKPPQARLPKG